MNRYQVKLYRKGDVNIILEVVCDNRHQAEHVARKYIEQGHADSMGAIDEISN